MADRAQSRRQAGDRASGGGNYFSAAKSNIEFISSGCQTLDLALSGGWAENRISNVVGDKAVGKTLIAIEAAANFAIKYPKGKIRYRECEAAFDRGYASALGMPLDRVDFGEPLETVEDLFEDLQKVIAGAKQPELYIVDSLDALSDRAEMERSMDEGTYGAAKAKNMSQMFRRSVRAMERSRVTGMIISQVRSKIGISFGRNTTRSGGRALDFYASQVLYLSSGMVDYKTVRGDKRPVGLSVRAKIDKNKVGLGGRETEFQIMFGFGINDVGSSLDWLKKTKLLEEVGLNSRIVDKDLDVIKKQYVSAGTPDIPASVIAEAVDRHWRAIDARLMPTRSKYGVQHGT